LHGCTKNRDPSPSIKEATVNQILWTKLRRDCRGQDLIEYALLAGFVAVAVGIIFPASFYDSYGLIWSRVLCVLSTIGHAGA
jgi:hypothetical protein